MKIDGGNFQSVFWLVKLIMLYCVELLVKAVLHFYLLEIVKVELIKSSIFPKGVVL